MAEQMMEKGRIGKQIVLPLKRAVEISLKSLRIRFWRSLITVSSIILAIAFLASILVTTTLVHQLHVGPQVRLEALIPQRDKLHELHEAYLLYTLADHVAALEQQIGTNAQDASQKYDDTLAEIEREKNSAELQIKELADKRDNLAKLRDIQFVLGLHNKYHIPVPRTLQNMKNVLADSVETLERELDITVQHVSDAHREILEQIRSEQEQARERARAFQARHDIIVKLMKARALDTLHDNMFATALRSAPELRDRTADLVRKLEEAAGTNIEDIKADYESSLAAIQNERELAAQRMKELAARRDKIRTLQSRHRALELYNANIEKLGRYAEEARRLEEYTGVGGPEAATAYEAAAAAIENESKRAEEANAELTAKANQFKDLHEKHVKLQEITPDKRNELAASMQKLEEEISRLYKVDVTRENAKAAYEEMRATVERERRLADNIRLLLAREGGGEETQATQTQKTTGERQETSGAGEKTIYMDPPAEAGEKIIYMDDPGDAEKAAEAPAAQRKFTFFSQLGPRDYWLISLALLVCFVGIVNAMLMSVTERFREIGTMKCLCALDSFIVKLFLLESVFQGAVGTFIGIVLGTLLSIIRAWFVYGSVIFRFFPIGGVITAILIAQATGVLLSVIAAVFPARAAARMQPVDALRAEE